MCSPISQQLKLTKTVAFQPSWNWNILTDGFFKWKLAHKKSNFLHGLAFPAAKKFHVFKTRRFNIKFAKACFWILSWDSWVQFLTTYSCKINFNITFPPTFRSPMRFTNQNFVCIYFIIHGLHVPPLSSSWSDHINNIR